MIFFKLRIFVLFFLLPLTGFSQSEITGNWTGILYQEPDVAGGPVKKFKLSMNLKESGGKVTGVSTIITGPSFGVMELTGTFNDNSLAFQENKIKDQKISGMSWCYKGGKDLRLTKAGGKLKLSGPWQGYVFYSGQKYPCNPGTLELTKEVGFISLKGFVVNSKTVTAIPAKIKITDKTNNKEITNLNSPSGEFDISLTGNLEYELTVESRGFLTKFEKVKLIASQILNIPLTPIEIGQTVNLKSILFEKSGTVLIGDSYPELDRLEKFLTNNPAVEIELQGHTSNEGEASKNLDLSDQRVKVVKDYLVGKGIKESRIKTKAFGSQKPLAPNDTEENKKLNRRVEFVILKK